LLHMQDVVPKGVCPFDLVAEWLEEAARSEPNDPNAMVLSTCNQVGQPSSRMVLLKGLDGVGHADRGLVFYTNRGSRKAAEIGANPQVSLVFHWKSLRRQVRIEGRVQPASEPEADAYFASRHRVSQLGAWASDQSQPLEHRRTLEQRLEEMEERFPGPVPRPPQWGGYRVVPDLFEFWQDMPYRLHDRTLFSRRDTSGAEPGWHEGKLYP
jgi:pyridoxamine 5'-phosphate oxidase